MSKVINIQPVTRIEGHSRVAITLDDGGNVVDTKVHVQNLRGFEKFCEGRPVEEMPRTVCHICGICPWAHHLASSKAADGCFGVTPPPTAVKLRRLMQNIAYVSDKILHFYFLAAPDFVIGPDADYSVRNVMGILQAAPDIAKKVVHMRHLGAQMLEGFAGRAIHPTFSVPGGVSRPFTEAERGKMLPSGQELLEFAKFSIKFAKENVFPKYMDTIKSLGVIKVGYLGTVREDGALDFYDGKLRMMKPDGSYEDFHLRPVPRQYRRVGGALVVSEVPLRQEVGQTQPIIGEPCRGLPHQLSGPNQRGRQDGNPSCPGGVRGIPGCLWTSGPLHFALPLRPSYRTPAGGGDRGSTPKRPGDHQHQYPGTSYSQGGPRRGLRGGPRGTLIHDYECDNDGLITKVNLIVGTTHNNAAISLSVNQAAKESIKGGKYDQGILNRVEMAIRSYDP